MAEFCLECLQKFEPNANRYNSILTDRLELCEGCGKQKQVVFSHGGQLFTTLLGDIKVCNYCGGDVCNTLDISFGTLVSDIGWDEVRNRYVYIEGQEENKPLAFKTIQEYEPYLNYRVIALGNSIVLRGVK